MPRLRKPCLNCGNLTEGQSRCVPCQARWYKMHPKPQRPHYGGDYRNRAREVRLNATVCWLCGEGARPTDPWTADHVIAGEPNSPLLAAHRSCNSRRGNKPVI